MARGMSSFHTCRNDELSAAGLPFPGLIRAALTRPEDSNTTQTDINDGDVNQQGTEPGLSRLRSDAEKRMARGELPLDNIGGALWSVMAQRPRSVNSARTWRQFNDDDESLAFGLATRVRPESI